MEITRENMVATQSSDKDRLGKGPAKVIGPVIKPVLSLVFLLFALLSINSIYLLAVTLLEKTTQADYQGDFYLLMFLAHLALGLILILPFLFFALRHMSLAVKRPNRYAVRAGLALFTTGLLVLASGLLLTRFGFFEVNDPQIRNVGYWVHVLSPLVLIWLFIIHRLAGRSIKWTIGFRWAGVAAAFSAIMLVWHFQADEVGLKPEQAFANTLIKTPGAELMKASSFMTDDFCAECHGDIADSWAQSAHRFSSFTNPFYKFSVMETRDVVMKRDGDLAASHFCAGCHDVVPLLSGKFSQASFDVDNDPTAHAGLTCTSCHAITSVDSVRGNMDVTLEEPVTYPFEDSDNVLLKEVSKQLIRAKPSAHKKGFLKPVMQEAKFCSSCHKAHIPASVNKYKWLRAQNHYDSFWLSGVSGHRVDSFYYPPKAVESCAVCHMPLQMSDDPAARDFDGSGVRKVHSHAFPAANTALAQSMNLPEEVIGQHQNMMQDTLRVDLFGIRQDGDINGDLIAPLDKELPVLEPGGKYLIETVVRNLRLGHHLTQGTTDSNQLWLDISVKSDGKTVGRSGGMDAVGKVDSWAYFLNSYVLTPEGERLDRRNGQDTFVALYSHQIPPGAALVAHYLIEIPGDIQGDIQIDAAVRYRKFDSTYLKHIQGDDFVANNLPITTLGSDSLTLPIGTRAEALDDQDMQYKATDWERWNDYGIGLLLAGNETSKGTLRQAEQAFIKVESLGRPDGPINLARVYLKEGRLDDAVAALDRAAENYPEFRPWVRAWLTAQVDRQNGHLDKAIDTLRDLLASSYKEARERNFDFSQDYRARNLLARTLYEKARRLRGDKHKTERTRLLQASRNEFEHVLGDDPENLTAHYNLALVYADLGDKDNADEHRQLHTSYKPDDHAVARAVAKHRMNNPAADHAAEPLAIYDLQRPGAYELQEAEIEVTKSNESDDEDKG